MSKEKRDLEALLMVIGMASVIGSFPTMALGLVMPTHHLFSFGMFMILFIAPACMIACLALEHKRYRRQR